MIDLGDLAWLIVEIEWDISIFFPEFFNVAFEYEWLMLLSDSFIFYSCIFELFVRFSTKLE